MLGEPEYVDDDSDYDWTTVVDDIDKFQLSDNCVPLTPLSQQIEDLATDQPTQDDSTEPTEATEQEELKESVQIPHKSSSQSFSLVVQMVPAFSTKELSVYADPQMLIQVGKKYTFTIEQAVFDRLDLDESKCLKFRRDASMIKLAISYKADLATCDYDKYIQHLLEHVAGLRKDLVFSNKNQFDFIYLCELFKLEDLKQHILNYMSKNVDKNQVFEFLRVASLDNNNQEARRDAYWIIVYIFLKKTLGVDIAESFMRFDTETNTNVKNNKLIAMLKDVDTKMFSFDQGFLECNGKKIDLTAFVQIAQEEAVSKEKYLDENNMHNLTNVIRVKSDMGVFSDYPHFYELKKEGSEQPLLYATRLSENSEFILSRQAGVFCMHGQNYMGVLKPNFAGTWFELYDFGLDQKQAADLPKGFFARQRHVQTIEYDSNFFAEKPRSFRITLYDMDARQIGKDKVMHRFENLPPKYNEARGCYTLNFFGRVNKASARNFQLKRSVDDDDENAEEVDEFLLSHGKCNKNNFNLDFRTPFNPFNAFAISLTAIGKKRVVG